MVFLVTDLAFVSPPPHPNYFNNITNIYYLQIRTDRLMTLLPIPPDCVALEQMASSQCSKGVLMELLGSLQHPYIYPVLDLDFLLADNTNYACLVMPFNLRGSLKDLIYKVRALYL